MAAVLATPATSHAARAPVSDRLRGERRRKLTRTIRERGAAVAFNPQSKKKVKPTLIDPGHALTSISCPTTKRCVAVDDAGQVLAGAAQPSTWKTTSINGASELLGIDCPAAKECVAVDVTGDAFVGRG